MLSRKPGILAVQRGPHCLRISPYGEFYPCLQFPLSRGNVRQQRFIDIWRDSEQLKEARSIHLKDLSGCSVPAWFDLHPLSGLGLHGRKHALTFYRGL
jgi:iron-sulfur cluster protein